VLLNVAPFVVILSVLVAGLVVVALINQARRTKPDSDNYPGLARINRWTLILRYTGIALGLLALPFFWSIGQFGVGVFITPVVLGCTIEASLIIGEILCFKDASQPGVAGLERRRFKSYVPRGLMATLASLTVVTAALTIWAWNLSAPDGRSFNVAVEGTSPTSTTTWGFTCGSEGPFPGPYYSHFLIIAWLIAAALAAAALIIVAIRPQNGADNALAAWDDALRRRSVRTIVTTMIGSTAGSLAVVAVGLQGGHATLAQAVKQNLADSCIDPALAPGATWRIVGGLFQAPVLGVVLIGLAVVGMMLALAALAMVVTDVMATPKMAQQTVGDAPPPTDGRADTSPAKDSTAVAS